MTNSILVVDDDATHRKMLSAVLETAGYQTSEAADGLAAVTAVEEKYVDLVLMDIRMKGLHGIEAQKRIRDLSPGIPVILMTAYASVDTAVSALKSGAYDYLTKPVDVDELLLLIKKALDHRRLEQENRYLRERIDDRFDFSAIIGRSPSMTPIFETISLVAPTEATVLIVGESGTGKELIANAIHQNSPRREAPFIKVNCAALSESLLESELFGHEKGAFTGAHKRHIGRFSAAHRGSLLLDEIGEMAPATQAKILRVLQEQEFEPVGGTHSVSVDVRIIAATNRDLEADMATGRFREDLFYRLNVVRIIMPPLKERHEDIPLLADRFLKTYAEKNRRFLKGFGPKAIDMLMRHDWPGNVRELENVVERAVILSRGDIIRPEDLPEAIKAVDHSASASPATLPIGITLKDMEKEMILLTLGEAGGNRTRTAEILGISRRTLQLKLKDYGVN